MKRLKKYFLLMLLAELLMSYAPAYAQTPAPYYYANAGVDKQIKYANAGVDKQIKDYLCTPKDVTDTSPASNSDLFTCINKLYKFALVIASVVGVFFIVIAGYVYMGSEGNAESIEKAKSILVSTLTALIILLSGYILLKAINPDLIQFQSIQPEHVTLEIPPAGGGGGGGTCQPANTPVASVSALQQACFGSNHATYASMIANKESGGNPALPSGVDLCRDNAGNVVKVNGKNVAASLGLFQINITAHRIGNLNCPSAFSAMYTANNHVCSVINEPLYNQCVAAALDANTNIQTACQLSSNGQNWNPWVYECGPH